MACCCVVDHWCLPASVLREWSDCCSTNKDAQPSAGAEEGRGDSPQNQSDATRPAEQTEGEWVFRMEWVNVSYTRCLCILCSLCVSV